MPDTGKKHILLALEVPLLIYKCKGKYYAEALHFGAWDSARSRDGAVEGVLKAVTLLLDSADELGDDEDFLKKKGFIKTQNIYKPKDTESVITERLMEIEWSENDPDKFHYQLETICLMKIPVAVELQPSPRLYWQSSPDIGASLHGG